MHVEGQKLSAGVTPRRFNTHVLRSWSHHICLPCWERNIHSVQVHTAFSTMELPVITVMGQDSHCSVCSFPAAGPASRGEHTVHQVPYATFMSKGSIKHWPKAAREDPSAEKQMCLLRIENHLHSGCISGRVRLLTVLSNTLVDRTSEWSFPLKNRFWAWHRDPRDCWFTSLGLFSLQLSAC